MTDDFILNWDEQNQQLFGEDPDTGDKIPVPIESISTEKAEITGSGVSEFFGGTDHHGSDAEGIGNLQAESSDVDRARISRQSPIVIGPDGFRADFDGDTPDERLDNAIDSTGIFGDVIYLEAGDTEYDDDRVFSDDINIIGSWTGGSKGSGRPRLNGEWTFESEVRLKNLRLDPSAKLYINSGYLENIGGGEIIVEDGNTVILHGILDSDVHFESDTSGNIIGTSAGVTVTGETDDNTIGNIS